MELPNDESLMAGDCVLRKMHKREWGESNELWMAVVYWSRLERVVPELSLRLDKEKRNNVLWRLYNTDRVVYRVDGLKTYYRLHFST